MTSKKVHILSPRVAKTEAVSSVQAETAVSKLDNRKAASSKLEETKDSIKARPAWVETGWEEGNTIANAPSPAKTLADMTLSNQLDRFPNIELLDHANREDVLAALHRLLVAANEAIDATGPPDSLNGQAAIMAANALPHRRQGLDFEKWWRSQARQTDKLEDFVVALMLVQSYIYTCTSLEGETRIVDMMPSHVFTTPPVERCAVM